MKITQDNSGSKALEKLADQIKKSKLEVGFFESATYPDGTPVAYVAAIQEFGHAEGNIPSRPFFRNAVKAREGVWIQTMRKLVLAATEGRLTGEQALNQMGLMQAGDVKDSITDGQYAPLKQSTLDARQSRKRTPGVGTKPLIDTARMLQSVKHVVEAKA